MKWDDPNQLYLGVLAENNNYKIYFIHVGPAIVLDYYSFIDIYKDLGTLKPGLYKPIGSCTL
jgi:hypothetical protein